MVAVASVGMMEVAIDQIIHMIAMGDGGVAAIGPVDVGRVMAAAKMRRCAVGRILRGDLEHAFVVVAIMRLMEVAIMQEVDVVAVGDGEVAAAFAVLMLVLGMGYTRHDLLHSFFETFGGFGGGQAFAGMSQGIRNQFGDMRVGEAIENVLTIAAAADQVSGAQHAETLGDRGEAIVIDFGDLGNAEFALRQDGQQTETGRVAEGFEDTYRTLERGGRGGGGNAASPMFARGAGWGIVFESRQHLHYFTTY